MCSLGPDPCVAEIRDGIRPPSDDARRERRAALRRIDRVLADVRIGKERADGRAEGSHQKLPFSRTRPMVSPAPPATASVATPISVFEIATLVLRLLVSSQ